MAEFQEPHETRLYLGVTHAAELFGQAQLDALQAELPGLKITRCVWKAEPGWAGFHGTAVDALRQDLAGQTGWPDIYLCGPPGMIDATEAAALALGVPADQVISVWAAPAPPGGRPAQCPADTDARYWMTSSRSSALARPSYFILPPGTAVPGAVM
jgi:ferredoxin-NADP reductase